MAKRGVNKKDLSRKRIHRTGQYAVAAGVIAIFVSAFSSRPRAGEPGGKAYWASLKTEAQVYRRACATCHGSDGTGSAPSIVGFDVPLPDFTDCNFATREPNADWFAIAHQGGPTRAFNRMMPAFGGALTDHQLEQAAPIKAPG